MTKINKHCESATADRPLPVVLDIQQADSTHQVVTIRTEGDATKPYRRVPCSDCPWRKDAVGVFPAEAFRLSARTAYDMSTHVFSCHQSGSNKPADCAGFLLSGAAHNLQVRLKYLKGQIGDDVSDGGLDLHATYSAMAIANGVGVDEDVLRQCR